MAMRARRRPTTATTPDPEPTDQPTSWRDLYDPEEPLPVGGLPAHYCAGDTCWSRSEGLSDEEHAARHAHEWRRAAARRRFHALDDPKD